MRLAYFGTPAESVAPLEALVEVGHDVVAVVTQPDRRRGRGAEPAPSPVKEAATHLGLPVHTPRRAGDLVDRFSDMALDVGVVVAYGQLLPASLLATARQGFVNLHFSLLPRWRGAAPVERAILAGDTTTGVCVMALDQGMDTGPVYARRRTAIDPTDRAGDLRARLVGLGVPLLVEVLGDLPERVATPQEGVPTHAPKLTVEEFRIDWTSPAIELARLVRAGNPRPGAWTEVDGERLKVLDAEVEATDEGGASLPEGTVDASGRVATGSGVLRLVEVQPASRAPMTARAWLAGRRGDLPRLSSVRGEG